MKYLDDYEHQVDYIMPSFNINGEKITFPMHIIFYEEEHQYFTGVGLEAKRQDYYITGFEYGCLYIWGKADDLIFFVDKREFGGNKHYSFVYKLSKIKELIKFSKLHPTPEKAKRYYSELEVEG